MELQDWSILKPLTPYFLKSVCAALVFGKSGSEALLLTRDDQIFGVGANHSGHLGLGDESPHEKLTEISTLSGKGVKGFAYGGDSSTSGKHFIVAYLNNNELCRWGSIPGDETPTLEPSLFHKLNYKVEKVACGNSHCVVLCENGKVYTWGTNEKGQLGRKVDELEVNEIEEKEAGSDVKQIDVKNYPVGRVEGILDKAVVIQISCGAQFTVVIINDGRVVSWGCNEKYQLGFSSTSFMDVPTEIPELKKTIYKVACGREHVVALCLDRSIQFWGNIAHFKSYFNSSSSQLLPTKLPLASNEVINSNEIGASYLFDFFVTINEDSEVKTYGNTGYVNGTNTVIRSPCHSIYEAFNQLVLLMPEQLCIQNRRSINDTLIYSFENQKYCDFVIKVEGKEFHVHKTILMMRSPYFETLFARWIDPKLKEYSIEGKNSSAIEAYLKFIYTDSLDVDLELAIELLLLADEYCDEDFRKICEEVIMEKMTFSTVVNLYPLTYRMKNVGKLNARCIALSAAQPNHLENMVNSDEYEQWDSETLQKFVPQYAKRRRLNDGPQLQASRSPQKVATQGHEIPVPNGPVLITNVFRSPSVWPHLPPRW